MGSQASKTNTRGTSSGINLNAAPCKPDPDLQSFHAILQSCTTQVINTVGVEGRSLSLNSLRQLTECLLAMVQEVVKVIQDCKQDIWNEKELSELVENFFDDSQEILELYNALKKCLQRARNSQLPVLLALQHFDEDAEKVGSSRYARTLQGLKKFKADGNPFTGEFFGIHESVSKQQKLMLEKLKLRMNKLDKKLKSTHTWRKVSTAIFMVTAVTLLITCPKVVATLASVFPIGPMGVSIESLWKEYENALKGQKKETDSAHAEAFVAKTELENVRLLIVRLRDQIELLMENVDFATEQEDAVKVAIEEIKKQLGDFKKDVEDLGVQAEKCCRAFMAAREEVLRIIKKLPDN